MNSIKKIGLYCSIFFVFLVYSCGSNSKKEPSSEPEVQQQVDPQTPSEQNPAPAPAPAPGPSPTNPTQADPSPTPPVQHNKRIIFFGDSLTAGPGIKTQERYPEKIQELLRKANKNWDVINAGVNGNTTADGLARIEAVLTQSPASFVFICLGGNDFLQDKPISGVETNLDAIIEIIKHRGAKPLLAGLGPNGLLAAVGYSSGSLAGNRDTNKYKKVFADLAAKHAIPLFPNLLNSIPPASGWDVWNGHLFNPDYMVDRIHPNAKGHNLIAEDLYPFLEPLLLVNGSL